MDIPGEPVTQDALRALGGEPYTRGSHLMIVVAGKRST